MNERSFGPAGSERRHFCRLAAIAHKGECTEAAGSCRHQALAELAGVKTVGDGQPGAAVFEFARRHRFHRHEEVVEAAGAGEAGVVGRVEHAVRLRQQLLRVLDSQKLEKALRADAGPTSEDALQVAGAETQRGGKLIQVRLGRVMGFQVFDGGGHQRIVGGSLGRIGFGNHSRSILANEQSQRNCRRFSRNCRRPSIRFLRSSRHSLRLDLY
jgi:hypothetical protein